MVDLEKLCQIACNDEKIKVKECGLYYSYLIDLQHGFSHWLALQLFDVATPVLLLAEGRLQNLDLRNDVKYDIYAWPGLHTLVWLRI